LRDGAIGFDGAVVQTVNEQEGRLAPCVTMGGMVIVVGAVVGLGPTAVVVVVGTMVGRTSVASLSPQPASRTSAMIAAASRPKMIRPCAMRAIERVDKLLSSFSSLS
jgi:hypothetical protein